MAVRIHDKGVFFSLRPEIGLAGNLKLFKELAGNLNFLKNLLL